jgi:hypothetical protein
MGINLEDFFSVGCFFHKRGMNALKTKIKMLFLLIGAIAVMIAPKPSAADSPDDIIVFVNNSVPVSKMNIDELKNLFLKRKIRWGRGDKVIPIHAKAGTTLRKDFLQRALGMTLEKEKSYWNERRIQSGVSKPAEFSSIQKAVFKIKGAIGYVYRSDYKKGVTKIVMVIPSE